MEVKMHTTAALDDHVDDEDEHVEDAYTNVASNENTTKYKIPGDRMVVGFTVTYGISAYHY
jgi:hypothetical protein